MFSTYVTLGLEHILPRGFDHVLFISALVLAAPSWRPLLWQVSAFTVAHALTLALAVTGVVRMPSAVVEPLIALSIVAVAVENIVEPRFRWRGPPSGRPAPEARAVPVASATRRAAGQRPAPAPTTAPERRRCGRARWHPAPGSQRSHLSRVACPAHRTRILTPEGKTGLASTGIEANRRRA
ncbi:MAG: HupE/UreJ family protein, partial [Planctomycetes bacterium]|nr:HupE/UreJ family protein [Planctomycetota bacterium]